MLLLRAADLSETHAVSAAVAGLARGGDMIVLSGEMGAGKTAFAQGFGAALGVHEPITSPTFTLVHSYPIDRRLTLHHADLYRLDRTLEVDDLGLHELASYGGIVLVEWGDVAAAGLGDHLEIRLRHPDPDDGEPDQPELDDGSDDDVSDDDDFSDTGVREIEIAATGATWAGRWDRLARALEGFRC
jgi:tRNA threonylcarbamoyladenosine biosynthesis protein TsaE